MFATEELAAMDAMISDHVSTDDPEQQWLLATDSQDRPEAAAMVGPEPFSEDVWNLYFIGTLPQSRSQGIGAALVKHVEATAKAAGARLLLVETSSGDQFVRTRAFYPREGFTEEGRIRDYYGDGDDKVIFRKRLA